MSPEITVLMSCYNADPWLEEAINSVLSQTHANFEFIIVDDGSTDNTLNMLRKYEKIDDRIKVITKPNTGLADSLNIGIAAASGIWIARLDADDLCEPSRLEEQLRFVDSNPQTILLGTGFLEIDAQGNILSNHRYPSSNRQLKYHLERFQRFFPHSSAFYRTAIVRDLGGYRGRVRLAEDWDMWLRLSEQGNLACLDRPLVKIRRHINQISHQNSARNAISDSFCAITSYFLRSFGHQDPIAYEDEKYWQEFRDWIELEIEREGILQHHENWKIVKDKFTKKENKVLASVDLIRDLIYFDYISSFLKLKFYSVNLPKRLAKKWFQICLQK